jgi:hypothetical protein
MFFVSLRAIIRGIRAFSAESREKEENFLRFANQPHKGAAGSQIAIPLSFGWGKKTLRKPWNRRLEITHGERRQVIILLRPAWRAGLLAGRCCPED